MEETQDNIKLSNFSVGGEKYKTLLNHKFTSRKPHEPIDPKKVYAVIPGTIQKLYIKKGKRVKAGEKLLVLEAMKMRNDILSPLNGLIKDIYVKEGDVIPRKFLMLEFQ